MTTPPGATPSTTTASSPNDRSLNLVILEGVLARAPLARALPSGDTLLELEVSTRRPGQRADTVPVTLFSAPRSVEQLDAGAGVVVLGRVQRRFYRAHGRAQSRTGVTADRVVPTGHRRRVAAVLQRARAAIDELVSD